ncbi:MAG TPA: (d)CMP kinase [Steroidobacteraceae bacterium]|nr:(d)CMP kinase [Steroidobacteraceae bacterium]
MNAAPAAPVVTIDGPSGAGKGTISRELAGRLHWHLLDSGALYRLVAYAGQAAGLAADDRDGHAGLAGQLDIRFGSRPDGGEQIWLAGVDVTQGIRSESAGMGASRVAAWPEVRAALLARQRGFARPPGLVADGRDMGTVVFPSAPLKIFLVATAEERALRRYNQLKGKDSAVNLAALSREIAARDQQDSTRPVAPLVPAADAVVVDSTGLSIADVLERVRRLGIERGLWREDFSPGG